MTRIISFHILPSGPVSSDDISDGLSAHGTLACPGPLVDSALEAHAHVATGVEDTVHLTLIADHALSAGCVTVTWTGGSLA